MANNCPDCGANLALVGRVHRCIPQDKTIPQASEGEQTITQVIEPVSAMNKLTVTYLYRDPDERRAYMRDYMRKRRTKG